ncbi:hypothetical protein GCM10010221_44140 [Streptomyces parvus]|nr:hypothetical protein GCM10010221_44140 [Streptomyces parvus]
MHLGGGQAQVGGDVPTCVGGGLPVQAHAALRESRGTSGEPGDVEWPVGQAGDALDERTAHVVWHRAYGKAVQRKGLR